jgi:hypothetical protein
MLNAVQQVRRDNTPSPLKKEKKDKEAIKWLKMNIKMAE